MLVGFPAGGLEKKLSFRQDKPYTTFDCLNVRPQEVIEGRERGGSRPGLYAPGGGALGSEIRMLVPMGLAVEQDLSIINESFPDAICEDGEAISTTLSGFGDWIKYDDTGFDDWNIELPICYSGGIAGNYVHSEGGVFGGNAEVYAIYPLSTINVEKSYTVRVCIVPKDGVIETPFIIQIGARITPGTSLGPWASNVVVDAEIIHDAVILYWESYVNAVKEDGSSQSFFFSSRVFSENLWFEATFEGNTIVSVSLTEPASSLNWLVTPNMAHSNHSGTHVGFSIWGYYDISENIRVSEFNTQYFTTDRIGIGVEGATKTGLPVGRTCLITSSGGNVFQEWIPKGLL